MTTKPKHRRATSKIQDRRVMGALGARIQPASGSLDGYKSDGRVYGKFRIETKYTQNDGFRLDVRDLFKVAGECVGEEVPIMVIDYMEPNTARSRGRFVVVPFHYFEKVSGAKASDDS